MNAISRIRIIHHFVCSIANALPHRSSSRNLAFFLLFHARWRFPNTPRCSSCPANQDEYPVARDGTMPGSFSRCFRSFVASSIVRMYRSKCSNLTNLALRNGANRSANQVVASSRTRDRLATWPFSIQVFSAASPHDC